MGCPFLLFLVPNQKPFMLPVAATTVALVMIRERFYSFDGRGIFLAFGCVFFAMSCKYSFLLSGSVVLVAGLAASYSSRALRVAIGLGLLFYVLLLFPPTFRSCCFTATLSRPCSSSSGSRPTRGSYALPRS